MTTSTPPRVMIWFASIELECLFLIVIVWLLRFISMSRLPLSLCLKPVKVKASRIVAVTVSAKNRAHSWLARADVRLQATFPHQLHALIGLLLSAETYLNG
jgi:hypothetical protein